MTIRFALFFQCLIYALLLNPQLGTAQQLPPNAAKEVEEHLAKAAEFEKSADYNQAAFFFNRAATVFSVNGFAKEAIVNLQRAIEMNMKIGNLNAQRTLYTNIGIIYTDEENYVKALEAFSKSLSIARQMGRKSDVASTLLNVANTQSQLGKHADAAKTLEEVQTLARELNDERLLRNCYSQLADAYEKLGNSERSSHYFSLFTAISQKIQREEMRRRDTEAKQLVEKAKEKVSEIEQIRQQTEEELLDKQRALKETEESLEQVEQISKERQMQIDLLSKEKELQDAIIENQRLVRNIFILIIFVVIAIAMLFLYNLNVKKKANAKLARQNKEIAQQKDLIEQVNQDLEMAFNQIEKQNRDITSSINYAQRIQEALLPKAENLSGVLPDSFIMFKPRDIVSGDFYWYTGYGSPQALSNSKYKNFIKLHGLDPNDKGFLISAVDCTGHGVPGAFMSMIGFNLLETIVRNGTVLPNQILNELHTSIRYLLKQDSTDNRDGMDIALCAVVDQGRRVLFSAAKNPLIYICDGELSYIKGDVYPVGGMQKEENREFSLHTINIDRPTTFFVFSDGFTDQFGGDDGKKFGTKSFKQLLLDVNHLPLAQQKPILEERMAQWMGTKGKQIDDIIIIGFRVVPGGVAI